MNRFLSFLAGGLLGAAACRGLLFRSLDRAPMPAGSRQPLVVRLHRFKLRPDALPSFDAWVAFEHAHHPETVATLSREKMVVEAIFRDRERDPTTIYWLEVHAPGGAPVDSSPLPIDGVYDQFMRQTLVPHSRQTLLPEYTLMPDFLLEAIARGEANEAHDSQR